MQRSESILNLDLMNDLFNNLKGNKLVQSFMKELSNYLENNNSKMLDNCEWNNLISDDLTIYDKKIITKFRDKMLTERRNILQRCAENTKEVGEMYYIYNTSENERNSYNLCNCTPEKSNEIITKQSKDLPKGASLGSVLIKQGDKFILDEENTQTITKEINSMIKEKIEEQNKYLESKRIDGHIYEVGEKYLGRIWLYDLNDAVGDGIEGIEEIEFPKNLYETAKEGDRFIYKEGEYQSY